MHALLELFLPPVCAGCGTEGTLLCPPCAWVVQRRVHEPAGAPVGLPVAIPDGLLQLEWCASFSGPARGAIHRLKYGGERSAAAPLASAMAARWRIAGRGGDLLAWVPVHPSRRRERGFDQAELLCRGVGRELGLPVVQALERRQRTSAQHALGRAARAENVGGAFAVPDAARPALQGRWVIVVDDVATTGATLAACAAVLRDAGVLAVSALVLARER